MKEKYISPECNVVYFDSDFCCVLTASAESILPPTGEFDDSWDDSWQ